MHVVLQRRALHVCLQVAARLLAAAHTRAARGSNATANRQPRQVGWTKDYEPWFIADRLLTPFYDRRARVGACGGVRVWRGVACLLTPFYDRRAARAARLACRVFEGGGGHAACRVARAQPSLTVGRAA